jgi:uncharacterized protein (TIGR02996 family)
MSDEKALLAAIWEHPHEDTPRLMYADWLQENDQTERARFIRLQCEITRVNDGDSQLAELKKREAGLWNAHRRTYRQGLPDRLRSYPFSRGFVAPLLEGVSGHKFFHTFFELLPRAPLWNLILTAALDADISRLFADERLLRVGTLRVNWIGRHFSGLVGSPYTRNISELQWPYSFAGPNEVRRLCDPSVMPHLTRLSLDSGKIGDEGVELIGSSPLASRLQVLELPSNGIGVEGAHSLARPGRFQLLERLSFGYDSYNKPGVGDAMVAALTTGNFPRLRHLRLFGLGLTTVAAESLAAWSGAPSLRHLQLHGDVTIRVEGIRALAASPHFRELETIDLFPWAAQRDEIAQILTEWLGAVGPVPNFTHGLRGSRRSNP